MSKHEPRDFVDKLLEVCKQAKETIAEARIARKELIEAVKEAKAAIKDTNEMAQEQYNTMLEQDVGLRMLAEIKDIHTQWVDLLGEALETKKGVDRMFKNVKVEMERAAEDAGRESANYITEMARVLDHYQQSCENAVAGIPEATVKEWVRQAMDPELMQLATVVSEDMKTLQRWVEAKLQD